MTKILISDFDNTLHLDDTSLIHNICKIKEFISKGNIFIIATGRSYIDISKWTEKYNIPFEYLICNDGGTIFNKKGHLIYRKDINNKTAKEILEYLNMKNLKEISYIDTGFDYTKVLEEHVNAIIIKAIDKNESLKLLDSITKTYPFVHGYISDNWINITEKSVSKASAINVLIEMFNFDKNNIYTIGDTINDISMIKEFNGSCMINATEDLKIYCNKEFDSVSSYIDYIERQ